MFNVGSFVTTIWPFGIIFYNEDEHFLKNKFLCPQVNSFAMVH